MLLSLTNTPRAYAWGSTTALAALQGRAPSGQPEAELWLGDYPGSPAIVGDGTGRRLDAWLAAAGAEPLPYLLKVLAAAAPLSLQAHPSAVQGADGFARENALDIALDAPDRNYRDPGHKPEVIVALSAEFAALCGFRPLAATRRLLRGLLKSLALPAAPAVPELPELPELDAPVDASVRAVETLLEMLGGGADEGADADAATDADADADADAETIGRTVRWLLADAGAEVIAGIEAAIVAWSPAEAATRAEAHGNAQGNAHDRGAAAAGAGAEFAPELANARALAAAYPGDPGVAVSLLMNFVVLQAGEALWLPAGNLHAYMSGLGVEVMAASDNVLRGGLTPKHVDVDELLHVLDTHPLVQPRLQPAPGAQAEIEVFAPGIADFELLRVRPSDTAVPLPLRGIAVALATEGDVRVETATGAIAALRAGEALLIADETTVSFTGPGEVFVAQAGA